MSDLTPAELAMFVHNPSLLQDQFKKTQDTLSTLASDGITIATDTAFAYKKAAEDTAAAAIQTATIALLRTTTAIESMLKGNILDPTSAEEI